MAWIDQLTRVPVTQTGADGRTTTKKRVAASFRGVPFFIETAERSGGRKTITHEYPGRDDQFVEDLGRRGAAFTCEGYVIGADYLAAKQNLLAALEKSGPGELIHPYYGSLTVACTGYRIRESTDAGGMALVSIDFAETGAKPIYPTASPTTASVVASSATSARAALQAGFLAGYNVLGQPTFALRSLSAMVASASQEMNAELSPVVQDVQTLAALKKGLGQLVLNAAALVIAPATLFTSLVNVVSTVGDLSLGALGLQALLRAYGFRPSTDPPPLTTSTRQREAANYAVLHRTIQTLATIQAAEIAPQEAYDSYDAAVSVRNQITDQIDEQSAASDDGTYAALMQLRADLVRALPGADSDLPKIVSYTPPSTVPSLVLCYQLYGALDGEDDILARNSVVRPGFVPGGVRLDVLVPLGIELKLLSAAGVPNAP